MGLKCWSTGLPYLWIIIIQIQLPEFTNPVIVLACDVRGAGPYSGVGLDYVQTWLNGLSGKATKHEVNLQGLFCDCCSPKKLKYGKPMLGESTLT